MRSRRAYALVLSLLLVVMLTTTGAGLALTTAAESTITASVARDLDHKLAVDSLVACLPHLLNANSTVTRRNTRRFEVSFEDCLVQVDVRSEQDKQRIGSNPAPDTILSELRGMARANGLPEENIRLRLITDQEDALDLPSLVWFDQFVEPTELEEVFRLASHETDTPTERNRATWSDLVSFWKAERGSTYSLEVETRIRNDVRRWYLVVSLGRDNIEVLYRGPV